MLERFLREAVPVTRAFRRLGSNLGDRLGNLATAFGLLAREPGFTLRQISLPRERPSGHPMPRYLNAVRRSARMLSPRATLQRLQAIEEGMDGSRERWDRARSTSTPAVRRRVVEETGLQLPHPLLRPARSPGALAEIAPGVVLPRLRSPRSSCGIGSLPINSPRFCPTARSVARSLNRRATTSRQRRRWPARVSGSSVA